MKIVYVDNPHDEISRQKREQVLRRLTASGKTAEAVDKLRKGEPLVSEDTEAIPGELHIADFSALRSVLPISQAPCVFLAFDELTGDFDPAEIDAIIKHVQARQKGASE